MSAGSARENSARPRRRLRSLRRGFWKLVAVVIIGSAALVSLGRLLAPYADVARPLVQDVLSDVLQQPVRIREIRARWPRMSPEIRLLGLEVGPEGSPLLQIDQARLQLRLYNLVRPARNTLGLTALGLDAAAIQDEQGRWSWQLEQGARIARGWERALTAGDLSLRDVGIRIEPRDLPTMRLQVPEAALARDGAGIAAHLLARPEGLTGAPIEIGLRLTLPESGLESLRAHARLGELRLPPPEEGGTGLALAGELWLRWDREAGLEARSELELELAGNRAGAEDDGDGENDGEGADERLRLSLIARGADDRLIVGLEASDPADGSTWIDDAAIGRSAAHWAFASGRIDLDRLGPWLAPLRERGLSPIRRLGGAAIDLSLGGDRSGLLHAAGGRVEEFGLLLDGSGSLEASVERLRLALAGDALRLTPAGVSLNWPMLFPEPVRFAVDGGSVDLRPTVIGFRDLALANDEVRLQIAGQLLPRADGAFVDLVVDTPQISTATPARWLPLRGLPERTRAWLARGLRSVDRVEAVTTLFGVPARWREGLPDGGLNSRIRFDGLVLDYATGWPMAEAVRGRVEFLGESMHARVESGKVAGVSLRAPRIDIPRMREAEIELALASAADTRAAELAELVRALPLEAARPVLDRLDWAGPASATARVRLPVKRIQDWRLDGEVEFRDAAVAWPLPAYRLEGINGTIDYDRDGFGPATLIALRGERPVELDVRSRFRSSDDARFELSLGGRWPLTAAIPDDAPDIFDALVDDASGAARFELTVRGAASGETGPGAVGERGASARVESDLVGLELAWPAPLNKSASETWPLRLDVPLDGGAIRFDLVDRIEGLVGRGPRGGATESDTGLRRFGLGFGRARAALPTAADFRIVGDLTALDPAGWIERFSGGGASFGAVADDRSLDGWIDVEIGDLRLDRASLGEVAVGLDRQKDYWQLVLDGSAVAGRIRLPVGGRAPGAGAVVADFDRLHLPRGPDTQTSPGRPSRLDPRTLPEIDVRIDDLRYGALALGRLSVNTHASAEGLEIEQLSLDHPTLGLTGSGRWRMPPDADQPRTRGRFRMTADSLGQVLADAGYDLALQRGQAVITLQGAWPGSPLDFTLQRVNGELDLAIGDGVIPEARPGAGRLLGLVSLNSIPRRLRLDFTDVFAEGLTFDRVAGHFGLNQGRAVTDDLVIEAPAAVIRIRGETDLAERTYDQTLTVQPGVGSALPIIGALTGGPMGAAAGAALQQLFDKPLRGISEVQYSVTGPWDDPVIVPVSARGVEALPEDAPAPDSPADPDPSGT